MSNTFSETGTAEGAATPALHAVVRNRLGLALRAVYDGACVAEPIPDEHLELLLRLRHKERERRRER